MKFEVANKKGNCKQFKIEDGTAFHGKKIGETISGDGLGLEGYELEIRGGSDNSGFPMRKDVQGPIKRKILAVSGIGVHSKRKGMKVRKTVSGNTIGPNTAQVNVLITKIGKEDIFAPKEEAKEESSEEKKEE